MAEKPKSKPAPKVIQTVPVTKIIDAEGNAIKKPNAALDHYHDVNHKGKQNKKAVVVPDKCAQAGHN